jgi:hypothetical protein
MTSVQAGAENAFVTLTSTTVPPTVVTMWLGRESPRITGGYGGWQQVERPRRRATVEWVGVEPLEITITVLMDAWALDPVNGMATQSERINEVASDIKKLDTLAKPAAMGGLPSPTMMVEGPLIPFGKKNGLLWVISGLKWGDTIFNTQGQILRQEATITFLQADGGEHIRVTGPVAKRPGGKGKPIPQYHIWKKGNTFELIAIKYYDDPTYRTAIMRLNGVRNWKNVKVGTKIKLPPRRSK